MCEWNESGVLIVIDKTVFSCSPEKLTLTPDFYSGRDGVELKSGKYYGHTHGECFRGRGRKLKKEATGSSVFISYKRHDTIFTFSPIFNIALKLALSSFKYLVECKRNP